METWNVAHVRQRRQPVQAVATRKFYALSTHEASRVMKLLEHLTPEASQTQGKTCSVRRAYRTGACLPCVPCGKVLPQYERKRRSHTNMVPWPACPRSIGCGRNSHVMSLPRRQREDDHMVVSAQWSRIVRYCAMLCSYASAGAWSELGCGGFRVKRRALKARNV